MKYILTSAAFLLMHAVYPQKDPAKSDVLNIYIKSRDKTPPAISWISPETNGMHADKTAYPLKVGVKCPSKLRRVDVLINGNSVQDTRGITIVDLNKSGEFDHLIELEVQLLEGQNVITVVAENEFGATTTETYNLIMSPILSQRKDYALIFATDEYAEFKDLVNPVNDAKTVAKELEERYNFEVEFVTNTSVEGVLLKLKEYATRGYSKNDQLFVFFAGHGIYDDVFGEGYIVGSDSRKEDPARTTYLSHSILARIVDNIPSEHIFLTLDVCFGGAFNSKSSTSLRGNEDIYKEVSRLQFIERRLQYKTRIFLTSGGTEYVPDGRPGMHSPFARKFLEGLRSNGGTNGILTVSEILDFVSTVNPAPHFGEFGSNTAGSDFLFVVK